MLTSTVQTYLNQYTALPNHRNTILTNNNSTYKVTLDIHTTKIKITNLVNIQQQPNENLLNKTQNTNIPIYPKHTIYKIQNNINNLTNIKLCHLTKSKNDMLTYKNNVPYQMLTISKNWNPTVHLHCQSKNKIQFDKKQNYFIPNNSVQQTHSTNSTQKTYTLQNYLTKNIKTNQNTISTLNMTPFTIDIPFTKTQKKTTIETYWELPNKLPKKHTNKKFINYQNNTLTSNIHLATQKKYHSIKHIKQYTTLNFKTNQNKTNNINNITILTKKLNQNIPQTKTTTFHPNYTPITFNTVTNRNIKSELFNPIKHTTIHK